eukprot:4412307-Pleurochrysis_carterae.AAC.1
MSIGATFEPACSSPCRSFAKRLFLLRTCATALLAFGEVAAVFEPCLTRRETSFPSAPSAPLRPSAVVALASRARRVHSTSFVAGSVRSQPLHTPSAKTLSPGTSPGTPPPRPRMRNCRDKAYASRLQTPTRTSTDVVHCIPFNGITLRLLARLAHMQACALTVQTTKQWPPGHI